MLLQYLCWAELLLASAFNPSASFFGHLCGILAGFLHVLYIEPGLRAAQSSWRRLFQQTRGPGRQLGGHAAGSSSGRHISPPMRARAMQASAPAPVQASGPTVRRGSAAAVPQATGNQVGMGSTQDRTSGGTPSNDVGPAREDISLEELRQRRLMRLGGSAGGGSSAGAGALRGRR